jgi:hypothetical protein
MKAVEDLRDAGKKGKPYERQKKDVMYVIFHSFTVFLISFVSINFF